MSRWLTLLLATTLAQLVTPDAWAGDAVAGKGNYEALCATCHGPGGKGDGPAAAALTPPPRDLSVGDFKFDADKDGKPGGDADLKLVIQKGAAEFGGSPMMTPWGLPDAQLDDLVALIRTLKP
jgi:mono/diheme cytochrome c family protein